MLAARNLAKAWLLLVGFSAVFAALGWALGGYRLASLFLFCALLSAGGLVFYADRVALGMVGARELPLAQAPIVHSTVERLALLAGIPKPRLYLLDDAHPRALSAGRGTRGAAVAVSRGLLAVLSPAELEGVLAHELAKIHNRDVTVQTPRMNTVSPVGSEPDTIFMAASPQVKSAVAATIAAMPLRLPGPT